MAEKPIRKGDQSMRRIRFAALMAFLVLAMLWACAAGETLCTLRVPLSPAGGEPMLRSKGSPLALTCLPEGKTEGGTSYSLPALLQEGKGEIVGVFWRFRAEKVASRKNLFSLRPEEGGGSVSGKILEGWNIWDLTALLRDSLSAESEAPLSLRLSPENKYARRGASLVGADSRLYVTVSLSAEIPGLSSDRVTDAALLDTALSALPEDHLILKRYQDISGSLTTAVWPTGVPYYYGGHSEEKVLRRFFPLQESKYYKSDKLYLCGFDCGSFLHWAEEKAGYADHPMLTDLLNQREGSMPLPAADYHRWSLALQPGDLIALDHDGGTHHIVMYIGTPALYGFSAESAPELADWLTAPLVIHCGEDPFCYDRFSAYIEANRSEWNMIPLPPDGGVTVSLMIPSANSAPHLREAPWRKSYGWFDVIGQPITAFPLEDCEQIVFFRPERLPK